MDRPKRPLISGIPAAVRAESRDSTSERIDSRDTQTSDKGMSATVKVTSRLHFSRLNLTKVPVKHDQTSDGKVTSKRDAKLGGTDTRLIKAPQLSRDTKLVKVPQLSRDTKLEKVSHLPRDTKLVKQTTQLSSRLPLPKGDPKLPNRRPQPVATSRMPKVDTKLPNRQVRCQSSRELSDAPADPETRQMIDRDTLRLRSKEMFVTAIACRPQLLAPKLGEESSNTLNVYVRKRPIFARELTDLGEFDVVSVAANEIIVHNCLFGPDLKTPYITHFQFGGFAQCFKERDSSLEIFEQTTLPLCQKVSEGGIGTLFVFGQTGSGKTFTMRDIEARVGSFFFAPDSLSQLSVMFVELSGKRITDLLDNESATVRLRERPDGSALLEGASQVLVHSAAELELLLSRAHDKRHTESTGANETSSRSHAVCVLTHGAGRLMLVDLAGTERRKDSMWHDRERTRESAEINASLHALKECIRWKNKSSSFSVGPFRLSPLTRILADTFTNPRASLAVIATVSPNATDTEHSISTLKTVHSLIGSSHTETRQTEMKQANKTIRPSSPKKWSETQVKVWLEKFSVRLPTGTTGPMLVRMSESRFVQFCDGDQPRAARMYKSLHEMMGRSIRSSR